MGFSHIYVSLQLPLAQLLPRCQSSQSLLRHSSKSRGQVRRLRGTNLGTGGKIREFFESILLTLHQGFYGFLMMLLNFAGPLMAFWWLSDGFLMAFWWLSDGFLMAFWWLSGLTDFCCWTSTDGVFCWLRSLHGPASGRAACVWPHLRCSWGSSPVQCLPLPAFPSHEILLEFTILWLSLVHNPQKKTA